MSVKRMIFKRNLARLFVGKWSLIGIIVLLVAAAFVSTACYEEDMTVSIDQRIPPTFTLSGSGNLAFFGVWEVARENQNRLPSERDGDKDTILWQIWPSGLSPDEKVVRRLPPISYGSVPAGFVQKVPRDGAPPDLVENKIYEAGGPASNANGGFVWFTIKGGKVLKVDAPGGN
ncbi:MAG TPA: hypothetical protein VJ023_19685 [Pyrinomonadaceae bacterium]|nr:hypothetical protein [Pyrinomonadaceae bacterium]